MSNYTINYVKEDETYIYGILLFNNKYYPVRKSKSLIAQIFNKLFLENDWIGYENYDKACGYGEYANVPCYSFKNKNECLKFFKKYE